MSPFQTRSPQEKENNHQPGPFEQALHKMAITLEGGINAMQSKNASTKGQAHDPTEMLQSSSLRVILAAGNRYSPNDHFFFAQYLLR